MTKTKMMTFKGTKQELVEILNGLYATGEMKGKEFALATSKNIATIKAALEDVDSLAKPSDDFIAFAEQVREVKDDKEKIKELEAQNPELVEGRKAQLAAVQEMLAEEIELELHPFTSEILPEEITAHQIGMITKLLID